MSSSSPTFQISTDHLTKDFSGGVQALRGVSLGVMPGEFFALLGPSGCGKSTLLRCLAGLEMPTGGHVEIRGRDVTAVDPGKRDIAMVFQDYALFPGMTVAENIAYARRIRHEGKAERRKVAQRLAEGLDLQRLVDRRPSELSGGQQQRVAIARAMAANPSVLLLDEPLSNLDARLRLEARALLKEFQQETKVTTVFVTHDQSEALAMSDRMAVIKDGEVQQVGTPYEIYHQPVNSFVAKFIGMYPTNLMPGSLEGKRIRVPGGFLGPFDSAFAGSLPSARQLLVGIRPEYCLWSADGDAQSELPGGIRARVSLVENAGAASVVHVRVQGNAEGGGEGIGESEPSHGTLRVVVASDREPRVGESGVLRCRRDKMLLFDAVTGVTLGCDMGRAR